MNTFDEKQKAFNYLIDIDNNILNILTPCKSRSEFVVRGYYE